MSKDSTLPKPPTLPATEPLAGPKPMVSMRDLANVQVPRVEPLKTLDPRKTVAGKVNRMSTTRSPLLETAQTRARQTAQARGILNSTMAEQAATQAVIDTATPIAAADAAAEQRREEMSYQAQLAADAEGRDAERRRSEVMFQAGEERAGLEFRSEQEIALAEADRQDRRDIASAEILARYDIARYEVDATAEASRIEREWRDRGVSDQNIVDLRASYRADVQTAERYWDDRDLVVSQDPNISDPDKTKMLAENNTNRKNAIEGVTAGYASAPEWDASWELISNVPDTAELSDEEVVATRFDDIKSEIADDPIFYESVRPNRERVVESDTAFDYYLNKAESGDITRGQLEELIWYAKDRYPKYEENYWRDDLSKKDVSAWQTRARSLRSLLNNLGIKHNITW